MFKFFVYSENWKSSANLQTSAHLELTNPYIFFHIWKSGYYGRLPDIFWFVIFRKKIISIQTSLNFAGSFPRSSKITLVGVIVWCHRATYHILDQWWRRSMTLYGAARQQFVKMSLCSPPLPPLISHIITLTHRGRDKIAASFLTTFSNAFFWLKMLLLRLKFHWSLFWRGSINNIPTLVQIMAWRRPGDKLLSETMLVRSPTHVCVTRPQWV